MIPLLASVFQGPLAPLGEVLHCGPAMPADAACLADLLACPTRLEDLLRQHARHWGASTRDLRPVASAWSRHYLSALLPPVLAAASIRQHVFPLSPDQIGVRLNARGTPASFHLRHLGSPMPGASPAQRYSSLVWQHLTPLFEALRAVSGVLWGNAARHTETMLAQALLLTGEEAMVARDRDWLLHSATWPQAGQPSMDRPHPLRGRRREITAVHGGQRILLHRQCCLYHLLPGQAHCDACPLAPAHRSGGQ